MRMRGVRGTKTHIADTRTSSTAHEAMNTHEATRTRHQRKSNERATRRRR
jgi:hypothetical protein